MGIVRLCVALSHTNTTEIPFLVVEWILRYEIYCDQLILDTRIEWLFPQQCMLKHVFVLN